MAHLEAEDIKTFEEKYADKTGTSCRDSLTGLYHFGFFNYLIDSLISANNDEFMEFSVAIVDLDRFKEQNRKNGYIEGDRLLRFVADTIRTTLRDGDIPARLWSDQFAILLFSSPDNVSHVAVERIRSAIQNADVDHLTVSVGLSGYPANGTSVSDLLDHAAEAVRHAKNRGKNRIFHFESLDSVVGVEKPCVLIVDDDKKNAKLIEAQLETLNVSTRTVHDGKQALEVIARADIDLIFLDVMMPGMNGFEICRKLKADPETKSIPIVLITALSDAEARKTGFDSGADDFISKPIDFHEFLARTRSILAGRRAKRNYASLENVLLAMANVVEEKDGYTGGHTERVSNMAAALGTKMGLSASEIEAVWLGGVLHDVGKIGIPSSILNKPGPLENIELNTIRNHADLGYRICLPLARSLGPALDIVRHHHEKLDGSSYPDGLRDDEISLPSRIIGVVDIYDALTSDRPFRSAMKPRQALAVLREESREGKLDASIVEALAEMIQPGGGEHKRKDDTKPADRTILVVEDDLLNQKLVKTMLELANLDVIVAGSAGEGIRIAQEKLPHLILMDIRLPDFDGLEATRRLKADRATAEITIIGMSAYAMEQDIQAAAEAGCADYITKPFTSKELHGIVNKYL